MLLQVSRPLAHGAQEVGRRIVDPVGTTTEVYQTGNELLNRVGGLAMQKLRQLQEVRAVARVWRPRVSRACRRFESTLSRRMCISSERPDVSNCFP